MTRRLSLRREALVELTTPELTEVNGAAFQAPPTLNVDCLRGISDDHTCIDCLTRFC